jgi:hypothetical protein
MRLPLMRTHASMQMERLQDGLAEVAPHGEKLAANERIMRLPWIFDRFRSR